MTYAFQDMLLHVKFIFNHLQWKKCSLVGHSMGGAVSMMFGALMPTLVDKIISIDLVKPMGYDTKIHPDKTLRAISSYFDILKKTEGKPPCYTYDEAKRRLLVANAGSITPESADVLMVRGTRKTEEGLYYFSRDLRQTIPGLVSVNNDSLKELLSRIRVPFMIIKGTQGPLYEPEELYNDFINTYNESSPRFEYVKVDGTHHLHLNTPERVASHIIRFLDAPPLAGL
ncbi:hypothetical protein QYM36_007814 [Artemia franciscana]|nr:hypothetical protein QYM36_007814 [Artemia franciscana]